MLLEISRVTNETEHAAALERLGAIWGASEGTDLDELNILTILVDNYEREQWQMNNALDPIDIIKGAIEHAGHTRAELVELLGSASRVSEILSRKRALTLDMIRAISAAWGIPQNVLTSSYDLRVSGAVMRLDAPSIAPATIVAVYNTATAAQAAIRDLETVGLPHNDISRYAKEGSITGTSRSTAPVHEKGFWASLFGGEPDHDTSVYGQSIDSGATVVTVKIAAARYDEAAAILEKHAPVDFDLVTGSTNLGAKAELIVEGAAGDTLQLAEEFLNVGKRAVRGGTTRIRRYTVEKPVEENVTLHNERVVLDRRPVTDGRVLANADFTDKTISMTEMNEEAVVSKTARVVEEIGLHKEASDRVETVRDTLRKDDVEVEQVPNRDRSVIGTSGTKPIDRKI